MFKEGKLVTKSISLQNDIEEDLKLISQFSRRKLKADEVYIFSLVLCDNEIDRDYERFTIPALEKLATLFVGKTGILDHNPKAENQTARIFKTWLEKSEGEVTSAGEVYTTLHASAYMVKSERNRDLILDIDAGIKKEISVGISVGSNTCSICGKARKKGCAHTLGKSYEGRICCGVLDNPTDAYEWSFVAVPAQKNAGVTKSHKHKILGGRSLDILKALSQNPDEITLCKDEIEALNSHIKALEKEADVGKQYISELRANLVKEAFLAKSSIDSEVLSSVAEKMSADELLAFTKEFRARGEKTVPQLCKKHENAQINNNDFLI